MSLRAAALSAPSFEHYQSGENKGPGVRVAFYEEGRQWKAFPTELNTEEELSQAVRAFPEAVTWTICLDGRTLDSLASKTPPSYSRYADISERRGMVLSERGRGQLHRIKQAARRCRRL